MHAVALDWGATGHEETRVRPAVAWCCALVFVTSVLTGAPAQAFETEVTSTPVGLPCPVCHGDEPSTPASSVAPTRKGPHGGYTTGTSKCESCHTIHTATTDRRLLPARTVKETCELCHDGTGGTGVYGTIRARTGTEPVAAHRVETTDVVPAGSPSGENTRTFSGPDGTLTCGDCHSPHDNDTVEPFVGDRLRVVGDELTTTPTNRLLKRRPGGSDLAVDVYGSSWCAACHRGSIETSSGAGHMASHPVETETAGFWYGRVVRVAGVETTVTELGPLGGSNFGYVMPYPRTPLQSGHYPICQQCHEDARHVGDETTISPFQVVPSEAFRVTKPDGLDAADNPRFQVFPHEGVTPRFRIEQGDDLCLNCHPG